MKYLGMGGWEGVGVGVGGGGWVGSRRQATPSTRRQTAVLCLQQKLPVNLVGQDSRHQQFDIPSSLISAHHLPIDPVVDHRGFTGLAKNCLRKQTWPSIAPSIIVCLDSARVWLSC